MLMPHPDLGWTVELMRNAHEGQIDKSGRPYYLHPLRVAMRLVLCSPEERHAALLHDVVEDTLLGMNDLRAAGYGEEVLELVALLTRNKPAGESHRQYMARIVDSGNVKALRVKLADLYDNLSPSRTLNLPPHELGIVHRFRRDVTHVLDALRALDLASPARVIEGEL